MSRAGASLSTTRAVAQRRAHRRLASLLLALALALAAAACHAIERPSLSAFRSGQLLGLDLERAGVTPRRELHDSEVRSRRGSSSAIRGYNKDDPPDYQFVWFGPNASAVSAELFFGGQGKGPRPVDAAIWTPRLRDQTSWRAETDELGIKLGAPLGFSPDFGMIFATEAPGMHALLRADADGRAVHVVGLLRTKDLATFLSKRGGLLPFAALRERVERALTAGDLAAARRDRSLLVAVVTGEASALLASLDGQSGAAIRARVSSGLASLGAADVPPLAQEIVALAKGAGTGSEAELLVARATAVTGLAQRWAASSERRKSIFATAPRLGLGARFLLYKEARSLARVKLAGPVDGATARFVASLHQQLLELIGREAARAEVAERPATAAALHLLRGGLRAPPGASGPEPASLRVAQALLAPLFAKLVAAPAPAGGAAALVRPAYDALLASGWAYFTRAGASAPALAEHAAQAQAAGNPPLDFVVDSASLDASRVVAITETLSMHRTATYSVTQTQKNPEHSEWQFRLSRLHTFGKQISDRNEEAHKNATDPRLARSATPVNPNSYADRSISARHAQEAADARQRLADDEARYEAGMKALGNEPPREVQVAVPRTWRYDVQQQRWLGTATRLVKVRIGEREEVLQQTFELGSVSSFSFERVAADPLHGVRSMDDWKDAAYVKARLPALMDAALASWLQPYLARRTLAAIEAHTTRKQDERRWLKYFFAAATDAERAALEPVEPGSDPAYLGAVVASAAGAAAPAPAALPKADRIIPMANPPSSLVWHPSGERFALTSGFALDLGNTGSAEIRFSNGVLQKALLTGYEGGLSARYSPDGSRLVVRRQAGRSVYRWLFAGDEAAANLGYGRGGGDEVASGGQAQCGYQRLYYSQGFTCPTSGRIARLTRYRARLSDAGEAVFSRDGVSMVADGQNKGAYILVERADREKAVPLADYDLSMQPIAFTFAPDGRRLFGALGDGRVFVWDALTGARVAEYPSLRAGQRATALAVSPDGTTVIIGYRLVDGSGFLRVLRPAAN